MVTGEQPTAAILEELVGQAVRRLAAREHGEQAGSRRTDERPGRRYDRRPAAAPPAARLSWPRAGPRRSGCDRIVRTIAADMVAEVCSAYVMRAGEVLELFATEGLKPEAVHRTRLRVGEGLVGDIASHARPLALADAQSHPNFAYRPETGEEIYHSLMGVPILRGGRVIGVLVVQNRTRAPLHRGGGRGAARPPPWWWPSWSPSGDLVPRNETPADGRHRPAADRGWRGWSLCPGLAIGRAVLHKPRPTLAEIVAENPGRERERLHLAVSSLQPALDDLLATRRAGRRRRASRHPGEPIACSPRTAAGSPGWTRPSPAASPPRAPC